MEKLIEFDCGAAIPEVVKAAQDYAELQNEARRFFPKYAGNTGWICLEKIAGEAELRRIETKAEQIQSEADTFVLIGVGGSNNAARSAIEALVPFNKKIEIIYAGNSTAPSAMEDVIRQMDGKSVFLNIIAKNFETLEPGAAFRVLRALLYRKYGRDAAKRIIATGTPGSHLHKLSLSHGWDFFTFPEDVGGRYSAFTDVGLLPMAAAGLDIRSMLEGAREMRDAVFELPPEENPALLYAAARRLLYRKGYRAEMLTSFEPRLHWFFKWWIQLFAESEGKNGGGLLPLSCECSEELHSMGQFLQEGAPSVFETFLQLEDMSGPRLDSDGVEDGFDYLNGKTFSALNSAAKSSAMQAHSRHIPCLIIEAGKPSAKTLGRLYMFFMLSCVFSCRMAGVNPFNQPGVEAYKKNMFEKLGKK